ncbi:dihydrolipoyl dehydrogenase [Roseobacteraceae bacterium NS-SX3]
MTMDVLIPDIGSAADVPVAEILVRPGDAVREGDTVLILESDKSVMDIPAPADGVIAEVLVREGSKVSEGTLAARMQASADATPALAPAPQVEGHAPLVVIGGGPGGYTAAFRAADLGQNVTLIDSRPALGGVCLNVGCIPSKALLHIAKVKTEAEEAAAHGLSFGAPAVDLDKIRAFKDAVVGKLTGGLQGLAKRRKLRVIRGTARLTGPQALEIETPEGMQALSFDKAIVAVGSEPVGLPFLPEDPRIMDSTGALELADVPERLLVIGGGIIGMEMAEVYHALGSRVEIVELAGQLIPGADRDLVAPLAKRAAARYGAIRLGTKVTAVEAGSSLTATFDGPDGVETAEYDRILVAVGRTPNGHRVNPGAAGLAAEGPGFLPVDAQMRTAQPHIFAIGDVVGQPMLAHKAVHEGKTAAEAACGEYIAFEPACIPSVAYTDPEVAWAGLTETGAKARGIAVKKSSFPWAASGRALSLGRDEGLTKLLFDPDSGKLLGAGIVGPNAGDLIAEAVLAIEMGADAEDMALTIHPHPTLSETLGLAAEMHLGTITDL